MRTMSFCIPGATGVFAPWYGTGVVSLGAVDVGMKDHVVAAPASPHLNLEPWVVFLEPRNDLTILAPRHGSSSEGLLERRSSRFR